jgi:hypothetical protein
MAAVAGLRRPSRAQGRQRRPAAHWAWMAAVAGPRRLSCTPSADGGGGDIRQRGGGAKCTGLEGVVGKRTGIRSDGQRLLHESQTNQIGFLKLGGWAKNCLVSW